MKVFEGDVRVWLKPSVFDPQGDAVEKALSTLGHEGVDEVRIGKYMQVRVQAQSEEDACTKLDVICREVLCNPVMETYAFTVKELRA